MELLEEAKKLITDNEAFGNFANDCAKVVSMIEAKQKRIIKADDTRIDTLIDDVNDMGALVLAAGKKAALAGYLARGFEFLHKRDQRKKQQDGVKNGESATYSETYKYTLTEDTFDKFNDASYIHDLMRKYFSQAKESESNGRQKVSELRERIRKVLAG
jgi:hypothetical protein